MASCLVAVIFLIFVSLGLPDSLLGSAWPQMRTDFAVPSSYAGYVSMTICFMTIISSLLSPRLIQKVATKWICVVSIALTIIGLLGFSFSPSYWFLFLFAIPYGLGAGSIDASINHYVANHYRSNIMNFLHCFYGLGAIISPNLMGIALKVAHWNEGYRWTAYLQSAILLIVLLTLPLWKKTNPPSIEEKNEPVAGLKETIKVKGVFLTLLAFFSYCSAEGISFLWTATYMGEIHSSLSPDLVASSGSLVFLGLMLGRLFAGLVSNRWGDRLLIRIGLVIEFIGILLIAIPASSPLITAIGFAIMGLGMGPIYPSIQHMAPTNFGQRYSASAIGMQMASAYVGSTFMPMIFGLAQQSLGISILPYVVLGFAILNGTFLELAYRQIKHNRSLS
ncbi:MAG: MFS transporter [Erysipelotrichaceae bacterium]|nr:MFS transporter [Erysipelotrichaceae bacterium]